MRIAVLSLPGSVRSRRQSYEQVDTRILAHLGFPTRTPSRDGPWRRQLGAFWRVTN
jgi:hypothetical protein